MDNIHQKLNLKRVDTSLNEEIEAYLSLGPLAQKALSEGLVKFSAAEIMHAARNMGVRDFNKVENDKVIAELINSTNAVLQKEVLSLN